MATPKRRVNRREIAFRIALSAAVLTFLLVAPQLQRQITSWITAEQSAQIAGFDYPTPLDTFPFLASLAGAGSFEAQILVTVVAFIGIYVLVLLLLRTRNSGRSLPKPPEERLRDDFTANTPVSLVDDNARFIPACELSPREFEYEVARIIEKVTRMTAQVVGGAGDNGVDIRVMDGRSVVGIVQCKRYFPEKALPPQYIRELAAVKARFRVRTAYLVTSSYFSDASRAEAAEYGIRLMDGKDLDALRKREYASEVGRLSREANTPPT